jgi:RimJ/RimL family protein N-acetyltransferase
MAGMTDWWPLFDLRLRTPQLELRLPSDADLEALASLAAAGVHDPGVMPFAFPWTDVPAAERGRSVLQYHWSQRAEWKPERWSLDLAIVRDGTVVGTQGVGAHDFSVIREVHTGSWLGQAFQGQGIGTEMRAAVLHLAFAGLGAEHARSEAFMDNPASLRVSRKLGYVDDGIELHARQGTAATTQRLRLNRATWAATRTVPVTIEGLEPCLPLFGLAAPAAESAGRAAESAGPAAESARPNAQ